MIPYFPIKPVYVEKEYSTSSIGLENELLFANKITNAVIEQSKMVSTNTSKTPRHPWEWIFFAFEDACAVGDEPQPASFDKIPLLTPYLIAEVIPKPINPDIALLKEKASFIIIKNKLGI